MGSAWVTYEFKVNLNNLGRPSLELSRNKLGMWPVVQHAEAPAAPGVYVGLAGDGKT